MNPRIPDFANQCLTLLGYTVPPNIINQKSIVKWVKISHNLYMKRKILKNLVKKYKKYKSDKDLEKYASLGDRINLVDRSIRYDKARKKFVKHNSPDARDARIKLVRLRRKDKRDLIKLRAKKSSRFALPTIFGIHKNRGESKK